MTKTKIFEKSETISRKKLLKLSYNMNSAQEYIILETLALQNNNITIRGKRRNHSIIVIKLYLHSSGFQSIVMENFFVLGLYLTSKVKSLFHRLLLYLLKYTILMIKIYLYFS